MVKDTQDKFILYYLQQYKELLDTGKSVIRFQPNPENIELLTDMGVNVFEVSETFLLDYLIREFSER